MNYIHYTNEFKDKIKLDSKKELIYNKLEDLRSIDKPESLNSINSYPRGILVLKFIKVNTCRIIIEPQWREINGERIHVLFIRDYISKKSFDYFWGNIVHPQLSNGDWLTHNPLPLDEISSFEADYKNSISKQLILRPNLPENLIKWLNEFKINLGFDVYERETWVVYSNDRSSNGLLEKYILLFRDTLKAILNKVDNPKINISAIHHDRNIYAAVFETFNIGIVFSDFEDIEGKRIIVLHDGAHTKDQKDRWEKAIVKAQNEENPIKPDLLEISKDAFRAYPKWIVINDGDELWNAIQRYEGTHNLSLLPEQVAFLNKFKFPAYINGQAGSGKSTMLYYLFANVYFYKLLDEMEGDIIFLTENDHLLENTSKAIIGLLSSNPEFNIGFSIEGRNDVRRHFLSFKNYLLSILPDEEKQNFPLNKYLDFPKFKELFNSAQNFTKKYSAEEVWFVISTYVYGYYEDKIIDSLEKYIDENNGIPSKFRIVSSENFKDIITLYLGFYRKLIEDGWWDKTNLVRLIRKYFPNFLPKQYAVVFCDEAQDFTRIELRLIIQSSLFTSYDLSNAEQIPIVFAGDALQTVSPTGFSDTRLHQMYYDAFHEANFHYNKTRSTYNPEFNYRSLQPIVRLANVIQNYRKETLKEDIFIKQESKRGDKGAPIPVLHSIEWLLTPQIRSLFESKFKYKSFIVPVDLNEESLFIQNELLLNNNFTDIKSSIDAKGAEYSQVVVYGFGNHFLKEFSNLSWQEDTQDFKKRFFFNKLYVAITRAQNELVIIDSQNAIDNFWIPLLTIPSYIERWEIYSDINEILPINPHTGLSSIKDSTPDDALHNATLDMEQGINDSNVARLIVASNVFLMLGKIEEAYNCLGHKERIRENWIEAGNNFVSAQKIEEAADAYFQAKAWNLFKEKTKSIVGNKQETRILIIRLMTSGSWNKEELSKVYDFRNLLGDIINGVKWYSEYSDKIKTYSLSVTNSEDKRELAFILESIVKESDRELWKIIGKLYFDTKQFTNAIESWNRFINNDSTPDYFPDYIRANIEQAKDEHNLLDEMLWVGRLSKSDTTDGERLKLSKKLKNDFIEHRTLIEHSEIKHELYSHVYHAASILGDFDLINELGVIVEKNTSDISQLVTMYACLIKQTRDEGTIIFLKERWAKLKWKVLLAQEKIEKEIIHEINIDFIRENFPFPDSNYEWSIDEILDISIEPKAISSIPEEHFKNIIIKNFRKFGYLSIQDIGQFNVILGNNNSGKTTLLEALLFSPDPDVSLLHYIFARNQRSNNTIKDNNHSWLFNLLNKDLDDKNIEFIIKNGRRIWAYTLKNPTPKQLLETSDIQDADVRCYLEIKERTQKPIISQRIDNIIFDAADSQMLKAIPFVPFGKGYSDKLSEIYFNEIGSKRSLRIEFIEQMKIFIPHIIDISINPETRTIKIEEQVNNQERSFSLHDYGEGANKLFRILVQLHAAKNKRLMIDEIDAGIHYSRFKEFWKIIIKTANLYNVQIFVSTHNDECIQLFMEVLHEEEMKEYRSKARIITLEQHVTKDEVIPLVMDFPGLEFAYEHKFEIRGRKL